MEYGVFFLTLAICCTMQDESPITPKKKQFQVLVILQQIRTLATPDAPPA